MYTIPGSSIFILKNQTDKTFKSNKSYICKLQCLVLNTLSANALLSAKV